MNSLVSVIIPAYNAQAYIADTLASVLSQTYPHIEVIVVNDGSSDDTLRVCRTFAEQDERIVLIDQENGGVSSARNAALDIVKGKYITFVDADDRIAPDMVRTLVNALAENNADMAQCDYHMTDGIHLDEIQQAAGGFRLFSDESICYEMLTLGCVNTYLCTKLYTRASIGETRFDTQLITGEDFEFSYRVLRGCRSAVVTDYIGYYYIRRPNTCTTGIVKEEFFRTLDRFHEMREAETDPLLQTAWGIYLSSFASFLMVRVVESQSYLEQLPLLRRDVIDYFWHRHKGYRTPRNRKLQLLLLTFFPHFYYHLLKRKHSRT